MAIQVIKPLEYPIKPGDGIKRTFYDNEGQHCWLYGPEAPGAQGPMHRHSADQIYICVKGEVTFNFQDYDAATLAPGMSVVIPKDEFYQIENRGTSEILLLGSRAESAQNGRNLHPKYGMGHARLKRLGQWLRRLLPKPPAKELGWRGQGSPLAPR